MERQNILVVDDDIGLRTFYRGFFAAHRAEGFEAHIVPDGEQALGVLEHEPVDIVVLDWSLPGISGQQLSRALRASPKTRAVGILMVTGMSSPDETVKALESGADDHLAKPFDEKVLLARLRSLIRRRELDLERRLEKGFPGLELDYDTGRLKVEGRLADLTPKESALLKIFLRRPNILHARAFLWEAAWGYEAEGRDHLLNAMISSLRRKLGPRWGARLKALKGEGFVLEV